MARIITDPIGDMLARIKNANQRKYKNVLIPFSKVKQNILKILKEEGFIANFNVELTNKIFKNLNVELKYSSGQRIISGVKRVSKPGLKVYAKISDIPKVPGFGIAIVSTSKGMMADHEARSLNIGGEVLAFVW